MIEQKSITIEVSPQMLRILDVYIQTGCYGKSREDIAQRILEQWCEKRIMVQREPQTATSASRVPQGKTM